MIYEEIALIKELSLFAILILMEFSENKELNIKIDKKIEFSEKKLEDLTISFDNNILTFKYISKRSN